jgi:hypothetical protein
MRFKYRSHSQNIIDTSNGLIYSGGNAICDLLNSLNEEIKDLNDVLARYEEKELEE